MRPSKIGRCRAVGRSRRGGAVAGVGRSGAIEVYMGCGLAVDHERGMGSPPGHSGLRIGARTWLAAVGGGSARRDIAGVRYPNGSRGYGHYN